MLRRTCLGRTANAHVRYGFFPIDRPHVDDSLVALRVCLSSCGLQQRLDTLCKRAYPSCPLESVARNRRGGAVSRRWHVEDFEFHCMLQPPSRTMRLTLTCVDDRGHQMPCAAGLDQAFGGSTWAWRVPGCPSPMLQSADTELEGKRARLAAKLHDIHRAGCEVAPACLASPGMSVPSSSAPHASPQAVEAGLLPLPQWVQLPPDVVRARLERLQRLGYLNCTLANDELKGACSLTRPNHEWLRWSWSNGNVKRGSGGGLGTSDASVSWWEPTDGTAAGTQPFEAVRWLTYLEQLAWRRRRQDEVESHRHQSQQHTEDEALQQRRRLAHGRAPRWLASFVGDSTARQQAVSLCCLLLAASRASEVTSFGVHVTKNKPMLDFRCEVTGAGGEIKGAIQYRRIFRADSHTQHRPPELTPRLHPSLLLAIGAAPEVLVINLGAWEYQEGCGSRHSLHDMLCNVSRPWVLVDYAKKWSLISSALETAYPAGTPLRKGATVVLRTATPRDFDREGRCRDRAPLTSDLAESTMLDPNSMRFAELSKNAILTAVAAERVPWVRVLDAYAIARLRVDAHPGRKVSRQGRLVEDCLHHCLPGLPDIFNGRLLEMVSDQVLTGGRMEAGQASPHAVLQRWNPKLGANRLVRFSGEGVGADGRGGGWGGERLALSLEATADTRPMRLVCPPVEPQNKPDRTILGVCSDLIPSSPTAKGTYT